MSRKLARLARKPLTPKQARFVDEYLIDLNATQAAIRAGYSVPTAQEQGARLLSNVMVAAAITERQEARANRVQLTQDQVLSELLPLLRSDVRDFNVDDHGNLTLREGAPDDAWKAVASVKHRITTQGDKDDPIVVREIEYKLWDKNAAIRLAAQHLGMLIERVETKNEHLHKHAVVFLPTPGAAVREVTGGDG